MADAWIYAEDRELAGELARGLAQLGFSPRHVSVNGSLLPPGDDEGASARRPGLVVVAARAQDTRPTRSSSASAATRTCVRCR